MLSWIRGTGWTLGFNDPSLPGWILTAGYFLAAATGFHLARRAKKDASLHRRFWIVMTAALVVLGLNKQLDLQTLLLKAASRAARAAGWYGQKEFIRIASVSLAGAAVLAVFAWLFVKKRAFLPGNPLLWAAIGLVLLFVFVRTSVLDGVFRSIGLRLDRNRPAHILELLAVASLNAALLLEAVRRAQRAGRPPG